MWEMIEKEDRNSNEVEKRFSREGMCEVLKGRARRLSGLFRGFWRGWMAEGRGTEKSLKEELYGGLGGRCGLESLRGG